MGELTNNKYGTERGIPKSGSHWSLSQIPDNVQDLDRDKFKSLTIRLVFDLAKLVSQYSYINSGFGHDWVVQSLKNYLDNLKAKERKNLRLLYTDPRFIDILTVMRVLALNPNGTEKLLNKLLDGYNLTNDQRAFLLENLYERVKSTIAHVSTTFVGLDDIVVSTDAPDGMSSKDYRRTGLQFTSLLDLLIEYENNDSNATQQEFQAKLSALEKERTIFLTEQLKLANTTSITNEEDEDERAIKEAITYAYDVIVDLMMIQLNTPEFRVPEIMFHIMETHLSYINDEENLNPEWTYNPAIYLYEILFGKYGELRTLLIDDANSKKWLEDFFTQFIELLNVMTVDEFSKEIKLDSNFKHDHEKGLGRAMNLVRDKLKNLELREALRQIAIIAGHLEDQDNDDALPGILANFFNEYLLALKPSKNSEKSELPRPNPVIMKKGNFLIKVESLSFNESSDDDFSEERSILPRKPPSPLIKGSAGVLLTQSLPTLGCLKTSPPSSPELSPLSSPEQKVNVQQQGTNNSPTEKQHPKINKPNQTYWGKDGLSSKFSIFSSFKPLMNLSKKTSNSIEVIDSRIQITF